MTRIALIIIFLAALSVIGLAVYKLIKSKLPDMEKVFWILGIIFLNILVAVPFIIYHDYFLSQEKRAS